MTLPLEQELHDALHHDLWLLQQAQALEAVPEEDDPEYTPPAHRYLPTLRDALAQLQEAREAAKQEIPRTVMWKIKQEARKTADCVETVARHEPEVRRFWLLDTITFVVESGIRTLEAEGRPEPKRLPTCTCGHNLTQHDMDSPVCLECQCQQFTARSVLKGHVSPELEAKIEQDRQATVARFEVTEEKNARALQTARARQDARALQKIAETQRST